MLLGRNHLQHFIALGFLLAGCNTAQKEVGAPVDREDKMKLGFGSLAGEDGITVGGIPKSSESFSYRNVNPYLWKASLEALGFMPLSSVDSLSGIIVTDWYTSPAAPNERIKVSIHLQSTVLQANALKVVVHKQRWHTKGWVNVEEGEQKATAFDLETIILSKARELKIQAQPSKQ